MAPSPRDLIFLVVRGTISEGAADGASEGAGEEIGASATDALLKKHPLSKNAVIAIAVASMIALLLCVPVYLCCRKRGARGDKEMGRYQQMRSKREAGGEEEVRGLVA